MGILSLVVIIGIKSVDWLIEEFKNDQEIDLSEILWRCKDTKNTKAKCLSSSQSTDLPLSRDALDHI